MTLLWAVPVVAAAAATVLVVAWARSLEDAAVALADEVRRLRQVERPLGAVRTAMVETDEVVAGFRRHHRFDAGPSGDRPTRAGPSQAAASGDGASGPGPGA